MEFRQIDHFRFKFVRIIFFIKLILSLMKIDGFCIFKMEGMIWNKKNDKNNSE
jgi:hypothetical protein